MAEWLMEIHLEKILISEYRREPCNTDVLGYFISTFGEGDFQVWRCYRWGGSVNADVLVVTSCDGAECQVLGPL